MAERDRGIDDTPVGARIDIAIPPGDALERRQLDVAAGPAAADRREVANLVAVKGHGVVVERP